MVLLAGMFFTYAVVYGAPAYGLAEPTHQPPLKHCELVTLRPDIQSTQMALHFPSDTLALPAGYFERCAVCASHTQSRMMQVWYTL